MKKIDQDIIKKWRERLKKFPTTPGVYLMKDKINQIIYVGKAKNLKDRVSHYFTNQADSQRAFYKTYFLVRQIHKIDHICTKTEVEAFLLEASLVKKYHPKYNIRLKDDKAYPYIQLSLQDDFPRFYLSRRVRQDGSVYFGPYTRSLFVKETIRLLNKTFQIRDCKNSFFKNRTRPCLTHQIGCCSAPCVNLISQKKYNQNINKALEFLRGQNHKLFKHLNRKMQKAATLEQFEMAARIRDALLAMEQVLEKLPLVNKNSQLDQDVIGYFGTERGTLLAILHLRKGRQIGEHFQLFTKVNARMQVKEFKSILIDFINQYYLENMVPDELLLPINLSKNLQNLIQNALKERGQKNVQVRFPVDTEGSKLLQRADLFAHDLFKEHQQKQEQKNDGLLEIQKRFGLKDLPRRIECFDISTLQGQQTVASQVVFENGLPAKEHYRRYKIKTVKGNPDDFACMKEVLSRRLKHTEYEDPDLILIDGGKGQLSVAIEALKSLEHEDIPVVSLAKAKSLFSKQEKKLKEQRKKEKSENKKAKAPKKNNGKIQTTTKKDNEQKTHSEERFFLPGRKNPIVFKPHTQPFQILVSLRDEAHRFAITHHRKLREKNTLQSQLDGIKGLGKRKKVLLLEEFETIEQIRQASSKDIAQLKGFDQILAERILLHLKSTP